MQTPHDAVREWSTPKENISAYRPMLPHDKKGEEMETIVPLHQEFVTKGRVWFCRLPRSESSESYS